MKWRNQKKNTLTKNNKTLDSFMQGISTDSSGQTKRVSSVIPKIKVQASSGLEPPTKPLQSPFLYPEYPEFRDYQYSISIKCVTDNTFVCLPTGLGKTHIASVMMLNFHLWFPDGLIFFLAPTKPLVDQQSMSLSNFSQYVSPSCVLSLTGSVSVPKRMQAYEKKRVFFCTPQTLENDLNEKRLEAKKIVLIIFDEAHKAVGNYAYANIARLLDKEHFGFRIIGLSATPGNDHQKIQEVLQNLLISNMIRKSQQDPDVKKYIKNKKVEEIIIQNTSIIREVQQILNEFISWPINHLLKLKLFDKGLAGGRHGFNPKCFYLINQQVNERLSHLPRKFFLLAQAAKCFLKYLSDCQNLLRQSGYQSFKRKFIFEIDKGSSGEDGPVQKSKIHPNYISTLLEHPGFSRIKQLFLVNSSAGSHPKLQKLRSLLFNFLSEKKNVQKKSKVIIFANLRYTCHEINKYLSQEPYKQVIKSQIFLGQAKTTVQTREGEDSITQTLCLSQKDQIKLIQRYKANMLNTLISTSIGEEGLDIGEVDAIFCYEGGMSTIRMIQRMGRTGRKRDGTVFVLLMQGKQEEEYHKALKKNEKMKKVNPTKYNYYSYNPTLFDSVEEIPISLFKKPEITQQEALTETDQSQKIEKSTKSKKERINSKENNKKTKKKKNSVETKIEQAPKSQQFENNEETSVTNCQAPKKKFQSLLSKYISQNKQNEQNKEQKEQKEVRKYFQKVGNEIMFPDYCSEPDETSSEDEDVQQVSKYDDSAVSNEENQFSELSQDNFLSEDQYTNSEFDQSSNSFSRPVYQKFDKLFDLDKLLLDSQTNQSINQQQDPFFIQTPNAQDQPIVPISEAFSPFFKQINPPETDTVQFLQLEEKPLQNSIKQEQKNEKSQEIGDNNEDDNDDDDDDILDFYYKFNKQKTSIQNITQLQVASMAKQNSESQQSNDSSQILERFQEILKKSQLNPTKQIPSKK